MKSILTIALLISILCFSRGIVAQTIPDKESFDDAEYFFAQEDYVEALASYLKLFKKSYGDNGNINYKIGICFLHTNTDKNKAVTYLEKAALKASEKYTEGSIKEENAPLDVFLFLGNAYRIDNQLDKAIAAYTQYLTIATKITTDERNYTNLQIEACKRAKEAIANPMKAKITSLGKPVNTSAANYNPIITPDENYMVFVSRLKLYDAIMVSQRSKGVWGTPDNITPDIQSDGNQFPVFISQDRNILLLAKQDFNNSDIYVSEFDGHVWTKSEPLNKEINTKYWESHASITGDGKTIYFTSNRPQSIGGTDIFQATLTQKGEWGNVQNIGSVINTQMNEETPAISADGKTLYFSSQGHQTIGGYDVFYTVLDDSGHWSAPISLGYPINTTEDDLFYSPVKNGLVAYQARDMKNRGGVGDLDIARIETFSKTHPYKYTVSGNMASVFKDVNFKQLQLKLTSIDSKKDIDSIKVEKDGSFSFEYAAQFGSYVLQARYNDFNATGSVFTIPENYDPEVYIVAGNSLDFATLYNSYLAAKTPVKDTITSEVVAMQTNGDAKKTDKLTVSKDKNQSKTTEVNKPATIHCILFPFNGSELDEVALKVVNEAIAIMKENPSLVIDIIGYTDSWGKDLYNIQLSDKRAKMIKAYFTKAGIKYNRINSVKGKGKESPIAINENENGTDNPEGRTFNRRVEFKIVKCNNKNVVVAPLDVPEKLRIKQ
jgi:outer membrane protein OmpA-like peptidoglycan-associated protein